MLLTAAPHRLPGALADPLHFPGQEGLGPWGWLGLVLLALGAAWLWRRWRRRTGPPASPAKPPRSAPAPQLSGFEQAIRQLEITTLASEDFRRGCHDLATVLRRHFERVGLGSGKRLPLTRLTAREIRAQAGDGGLTRLLADLAQLRFGRKAPDRDDFRQACDAARRLPGGRRG